MDSASRVAAPASAAFPPCSRILMPVAVAAALPETTTPWLPTATLGCLAVTGVCVACGQAKETSKRRETVDIEMILRIRGELRCSSGHHTRQCHQGYIKSLNPHVFLGFGAHCWHSDLG